jgi:hypothetical protein
MAFTPDRLRRPVYRGKLGLGVHYHFSAGFGSTVSPSCRQRPSRYRPADERGGERVLQDQLAQHHAGNGGDP